MTKLEELKKVMDEADTEWDAVLEAAWSDDSAEDDKWNGIVKAKSIAAHVANAAYEAALKEKE